MSEKLLIKKILDIEIPQNQLPYNVGVVVHNVFTAYAVWDAVVNGEPLVSRGLTIYEEELGGKNLWVRMGAPIDHILKFVGLSAQNYDRIVLGSILMGKTILDPSIPILKATSGITVFKKQETYPYLNSLPYIRCNYCNIVFPIDIYPQLIMEATQKENSSWLKKLHVEACIDCGLCSYVCPSPNI